MSNLTHIFQQALKGQAVKMRDGQIAYIFADLSHLTNEEFIYLGGYRMQYEGANGEPEYEFEEVRWNKEGISDRLNSLGDITGLAD